jgi:hypothetical protein
MMGILDRLLGKRKPRRRGRLPYSSKHASLRVVIVEMRRGGCTFADIGLKLGVGKSTAHYQYHRYFRGNKEGR